jgi:hypothetical protein
MHWIGVGKGGVLYSSDATSRDLNSKACVDRLLPHAVFLPALKYDSQQLATKVDGTRHPVDHGLIILAAVIDPSAPFSGRQNALGFPCMNGYTAHSDEICSKSRE